MDYNQSTIFHYKQDRTSLSALGVVAYRGVAIPERSLRYRFHPHFHPFPSELVKRLIEGSVAGLQAADTDYMKNAVCPNSTRVTMPDGRSTTLLDDSRVRLPDGTALTLPDNRLLLIDEGTELTLQAEVEVIWPDGTTTMYPRGTRVIFTGVKPLPGLYEEFFDSYGPTDLVLKPYPVKDLDFSPNGAYAVYNWELFYHVPLTIAIHLSKNQRFAEAQRWFHYVFDPTDDSDGPTPERFWRVKPFQYTDVKKIEEILINLVTGDDPDLRETTVQCIQKWKNEPFRPHLVARYRQTPYMFKAVMAYLDNLITWGDSLFREDTRESINEATQIYVLAANILGPRPQAVPKKGSLRPQTYANLKRDLEVFGTVLREMEADIPFDILSYPSDAAGTERSGTLRSIGHALYFCIPRNDKLLSYWDTVADRLFKIRNSLNIHGIFRQLPLFEPPIDPALLAKAAAAGLEVGAVISGVNQPLPLVRFQLLVQKAAEICQEVKSLGSGVLSAMEKEDNEALALLRAQYERIVLRLAETVRYSQWQEAIKAREGLEKSLAGSYQRYKYYQLLLGKNEDEIKNTIPEMGENDVPKLVELDVEDIKGLESGSFTADEPEVQPLEIRVDIARDVEGIAAGRKINRYEASELRNMKKAHEQEALAGFTDMLASVLSLIPQFNANAEPMGIGASTGFGGVQLSKMLSLFAGVQRLIAAQFSYDAQQNARVAAFARREQEWEFQSNLAAGEITQIFKQLRAAQIREFIAEREWENHQTQIKNAEEMEHFLNGEATQVGDKQYSKTSTQAFYTWMKKEVKGLYGECFQFAFDIARKAERALQHELGDTSLSYLGLSYLAGKEGLLAGEKLYLDIKRMEMAYHEQNRREYELTKHISLSQVDPLALMQLRVTGRCTFELPEALFDMDCPGHYFRRIRSVAVSIPCVTGPYSSVNCTLTLLKSSIRKSPLISESENPYARQGADNRFSDYFGSLQSIVTSSGQHDSGMFETNLRDERFLPFEYSGVISEWQLQLPANPSESEPLQFDYFTISDVILHIRYTAREGGELLRSGAIAQLSALIENAQAVGSVRLFSLRHEFPSEWARFKAVEIGTGTGFIPLTIVLREEHYPFWSQGRLGEIRWGKVLAETTEDVGIARNAAGEHSYPLDGALGSLRIARLQDTPVSPIGEFTLYLSTNNIEELWLALAWGAEDAD